MTTNPTYRCRVCGYDVLALGDGSNPYQRCPNCQGAAWRFVSGGALAETMAETEPAKAAPAAVRPVKLF